MKMNAEPRELDGFERKLLTALLAVDAERPVTNVASSEPRRGPVRRRTLAVLTGVLAAGSLTAGAVAVLTDPASFQPGGGAVVRGEEIVLKGSGCGPGETVSFRLDGAPLVSATAETDGYFIVPVRIPSSTVIGPHQLMASCANGDGSTLTQQAPIEVLAAAEPLGPSFAVGGETPAGGSARMKGSGCAASTGVSLVIDGIGGGAQTTAGGDGTFFADVAIPGSTKPGTYRITATCDDANGEPLVQHSELVLAAANSDASPADKAKRASG